MGRVSVGGWKITRVRVGIVVLTALALSAVAFGSAGLAVLGAVVLVALAVFAGGAALGGRRSPWGTRIRFQGPLAERLIPASL
jgi:K+-transporting ATPase A subunit